MQAPAYLASLYEWGERELEVVLGRRVERLDLARRTYANRPREIGPLRREVLAGAQAIAA